MPVIDNLLDALNGSVVLQVHKKRSVSSLQIMSIIYKGWRVALCRNVDSRDMLRTVSDLRIPQTLYKLQKSRSHAKWAMQDIMIIGLSSS